TQRTRPPSCGTRPVAGPFLNLSLHSPVAASSLCFRGFLEGAPVRPVRILFGTLPPSLEDDVMDLIRSQPGIEVVGAAAPPTELLLAAGSLDVDVVVVGAPPGSEPPGIASHLLDQYPHLRVLAVAPD